MAVRTLMLTSLLGGALATIIAGVASFVIQGGFSLNDVLVAILVGVGSGIGIYFAFLKRLGKKSC